MKHKTYSTWRRRGAVSAVVAGALILTACSGGNDAGNGGGSGGNSDGAGTVISLSIGSGVPIGTFASIDSVKDIFIPEITKRVAEETDYELEISEYFGTTAGPGEEIDAVGSGQLDIGTNVFPYNPSELALHNMPYYVPFSSADLELTVDAYREVYDAHSGFNEVYGEYNLEPLAFIGVGDYGIVSDFAIDSFADVQGQEIAGVGANLAWLEPAGAVPVQAPSTEWYSSLQTGVYNGVVFFGEGFESLRLYEVLDYFNDIQFGSIPVGALTVNLDTWDSLPPEVQDVIAEVGLEFEKQSATFVNDTVEAGRVTLVEEGVEIVEVDEQLRQQWAEALSDLPRDKAAELDSAGFPGTEVIKAYIQALEDRGYTFPLDYQLD